MLNIVHLKQKIIFNNVNNVTMTVKALDELNGSQYVNREDGEQFIACHNKMFQNGQLQQVLPVQNDLTNILVRNLTDQTFN
jgi:hypothetical protein